MTEKRHSSREEVLIAADIVLICLPIIAVSLRIISRRCVPSGIRYDDYAMLATLPIGLAIPALNLACKESSE